MGAHRFEQRHQIYGAVAATCLGNLTLEKLIQTVRERCGLAANGGRDFA